MPGQGRRNYDHSVISKAIEELETTGASFRKIAAKYGIPKSTLEFRKKKPGHKETFGPSPILTTKEEGTLVQWVIDLARKGFARKKEDILTSVQKFLISTPRLNPFKDNKPGDGWFKAFLKRHPEVAQRTSEAVTTASSCVSEPDIRKWFAETEAYLIEKNLLDVITDASRVFNGDETGFQICPSTGKVFAQKGAKNVYSIDRGSSKENITVMFTFSGNGAMCCPMIVYPYKRIPEKISTSVDPSWGIGRSDNGWMTSETFYQYIANVFHPHLIENGVEFPVILFVDGHKSHLSYDLSVLCNELQIEVIALYPNATRILQPADVAAFRPLKVAWRKAVREWQAAHTGESLNKVSFGPLLKTVVETSIKPDTLIAGFKVCGLCPFDANAIDYSKCLGSKAGTDQDRAKDVSNNEFLNYPHFQEIVGEETILKFEEINAVFPTDDSENFLKLYKIWKHFKSIKKVNILQNIVLKPSSASSASNVYLAVEDPVTPLFNSDNEEIMTRPLTLEDGDDLPVETLTGANNSQELYVKKVSSADVNLESSSASSPSNKLVNSGLLGNFLTRPESPKRRGKRNTERYPFAITSRKHQEMFEKKKELEKVAESQKAERKRRREETKQNKEDAKKQPNPKKIKAKAKAELMKESCKICNCLVSISYLRCDQCKLVFHKKCIPSGHKRHIPDDEDDDLFLCNNCYNEESDDSCDEYENEYAEEEESTEEKNAKEKESNDEQNANKGNAKEKESDEEKNDKEVESDQEQTAKEEETDDEVDQMYEFYLQEKSKY